jgi:hypothetical protein
MYYIRYRYPSKSSTEIAKAGLENATKGDESASKSGETKKATESITSEKKSEAQTTTQAAAETTGQAEALKTESKPESETESKTEQSAGSESQAKVESEAKDNSEDGFDEGEEYTSYRRTIFRGSNGLVHCIIEEQNGKTGEVKVTEERRIGDQSMTLHRVLNSEGAVAKEFETHENIGDDEESLQKFKEDWTKFAPTKNRSLKQ